LPNQGTAGLPLYSLAQVEHSKWYDLFADPTIADAIMGRVIHNAYILSLDSKRFMRQVMAEDLKDDLS